MSIAWISSDKKIRSLYTLYRLISEAPRPQGGASGKCGYDYRVGFPPRLPAYRRAGRAGHPADLPVTCDKETRIATKTKSITPEDRRSSVNTTLLLVQGHHLLRGCKRDLGKDCP